MNANLLALVIIVNGQMSLPDLSAVYGSVCVIVRVENIPSLSEYYIECKNLQNTGEL
jgi:hypothetical protein